MFLKFETDKKLIARSRHSNLESELERNKKITTKIKGQGQMSQNLVISSVITIMHITAVSGQYFRDFM